jgi:hypothetical protein
MNASKFMINIAATQKNLHTEALNPEILKGTNLIEEKPEGRQLNGEKIDLVNSPEFTVLPIHLAIAAGALIVFRLLYKREQSDIASNFLIRLDDDQIPFLGCLNDRVPFLTRLNQVPCMNCHFFTMNPYLKCAVNPATVLTKQAIDCPDYHPRDSKSLR